MNEKEQNEQLKKENEELRYKLKKTQAVSEVWQDMYDDLYSGHYNVVISDPNRPIFNTVGKNKLEEK